MISKGQMKDNGALQDFAEQFYSLASWVLLLISRFSQLKIVTATKPPSGFYSRWVICMVLNGVCEALHGYAQTRDVKGLDDDRSGCVANSKRFLLSSTFKPIA